MLWSIIAQVVHTKIAIELPPATFKRILLPAPPKPPKVVQKVTPPKPKPLQQPKTAPPLKQLLIRPPVRHDQNPPPPQHNEVITAKAPSANTSTALPGGTAPVGQPIETQSQASATAPQPSPQPAPPPVVQQQPPPPKPAPPPGPTEDAQPSNQVYPDIPDDLKTDDYQSFVRVKVDIDSNGSFTVTLVSSSGDEEIDRRVLDALKKWKWSPALSDGVPIESTERFRFNFEVQ